MKDLRASLCFCSKSGRSEKIKESILLNKSSAIAKVSTGTGFLIHRNLLLTTHTNLPSVAAVENAEILFEDHMKARFNPQRFFITSSVLDLTIVGFDNVDTDVSNQSQHPHYLKTCSHSSLELGGVVYLLGHTNEKKLTVGEGKVVIATDNLIKFSTHGIIWCPGSAGFDIHGNLAFMVCDPMKQSSSPQTKSSTTVTSFSTTSSKKDISLQYAIPFLIINDWLNQNCEGSLNEHIKPKLPIMRLMPTGQKPEYSCPSFSQRQIFKPDDETDVSSSSSQVISKPRNLSQSGYSSAMNECQDETSLSDLCPTQDQHVSIPEMYATPSFTSPVQKNDHGYMPLLDINFPPKMPKATVFPSSIKRMVPHSNDNVMKIMKARNCSRKEQLIEATASNLHENIDKIPDKLEVLVSEIENDGYSSEGETIYSAETMESRNCPTTPKGGTTKQFGRSHSLGAASRSSSTYRGSLEKHRALFPQRKTYSQAGISHKSHDYFSPTVSSIMKKRNNSDMSTRPRRENAIHMSPKWMF